MLTAVGKGAGIVRIGSTLYFWLTHSQMSIEIPGNSSETPFSLVFNGFSGLECPHSTEHLFLYGTSTSGETRDVGRDSVWSATLLEWHVPRGSPQLNRESLSEAYESKFSRTHGRGPQTMAINSVGLPHRWPCMYSTIRDGWRVCN